MDGVLDELSATRKSIVGRHGVQAGPADVSLPGDCGLLALGHWTNSRDIARATPSITTRRCDKPDRLKCAALILALG